ncbi:MAG: glycosyltransferase family 4 protein [Bacillota bacterium]
MKICHVITLAEFGGAQKIVYSLARGQAEKGHQVTVIAAAEGELWQWLRAAEGIECIKVPQLVREISPGRDLLALYWLWRFFRRQRPDVVHCHSSKAGILGRLAARLAGVPAKVFTVHGWSFYAPTHPLIRKFYIWLEKIAAHWGDALVFVSEADCRAAAREGIASRLNLTIHNGLPWRQQMERQKARRCLGLPLKRLIIGTVGRLSEPKNPLYVLEVLAELAKQMDFLFLWVGDGPLATAARKKATGLGISEHCRFVGYQEDPGPWLAAMDVFILLSRFEGLPLVIIEAMQQGVPVVAHAVGGIDELVKEGVNGFLISPGDKAAAVTRLKELVESPELAAALGQQGREIAMASFTQETMLEKYLAVYKKLLLKKGRED